MSEICVARSSVMLLEESIPREVCSMTKVEYEAAR